MKIFAYFLLVGSVNEGTKMRFKLAFLIAATFILISHLPPVASADYLRAPRTNQPMPTFRTSLSLPLIRQISQSSKVCSLSPSVRSSWCLKTPPL